MTRRSWITLDRHLTRCVVLDEDQRVIGRLRAFELAFVWRSRASLAGPRPIDSSAGLSPSRRAVLLRIALRRGPGDQPDVVGTHLLAPRTQVIAQRVGLDGHRWNLILSLPVPGIKAASPPVLR